METKTTLNRTQSLKLGAARSHARLARQLSLTSGRLSTGRFSSSDGLFDSLWSPLRLDLLKTPLTRYRE